MVAVGCDAGGAGATDAGVDATVDRVAVDALDVVAVDRVDAGVGVPARDVPLVDLAGCAIDAATLVTLNGTVYDTQFGNPIEGATVSVEDGCPLFVRTTAANGGYGMRLPRGVPTFLRAASDATVPFIRGFVLPDVPTIQDFYVLSWSLFGPAARSLGINVDPTRGHVWVSFENATVAGYGATLSAAHGAPLTRAADSDYAVALSRTTLAGGAGHWFLVFPNIEAGSTTIEVTAPSGHRCTPRQPLVADWIVRAGVVTYYEADCD